MKTREISSGVISGVSGMGFGIGGGREIHFGKKVLMKFWFKRLGVGEFGKKGI